jgi:hypothetical protein
MAKRHDRPSAQYRYEHYDPRYGSPISHLWIERVAL